MSATPPNGLNPWHYAQKRRRLLQATAWNRWAWLRYRHPNALLSLRRDQRALAELRSRRP